MLKDSAAPARSIRPLSKRSLKPQSALDPVSGAGTARLQAAVRALVPELVRIRREIHQWPELSFQEVRTAERIATSLRALGFEVETGVARTGVVGLLRGARGDRTVLVRADMDALPLTELSEVPYASRIPGVMHACGHDAHVAMLLGVARVLAGLRTELAGNVKFVFQPAEEGPGGAQLMLAAGVLSDPRVDMVLGFHVWNELPVGLVGVRSGPVMASADEITLQVEGKGGHGADPHLSVDAVVVAAHIVTALQTIVSRQISPLETAVLTIGSITAGSGHNIIAHSATMTGTIRTFSEALRGELPGRIRQLAEGVAQAFGARCTVKITRQCPVTVNDPQVACMVERAARRVLGEDRVVLAQPTMGAEDIGYFLQEVPGCYLFVGAANPEKGLDQPHHHPRFDIDEEAMPAGVSVLVQAILDGLEAS